MERCPICGGQLLSCGHGYQAENGRLDLGDRIPYVEIPLMCRLCGVLWPEMFMVPDPEWDYHVIPSLQGEMLCWQCYEWMKEIFPDGWRAVSSEKLMAT